MIYTAIDTFYLTDEQLKKSPSRKDGIDEATETTLRIYGCDLIQESGILLRLYPFCLQFIFLLLILLGNFIFLLYQLKRSFCGTECFDLYFQIPFFDGYLDCFRPQAVMATGQVLFHRFYCKKSFARFSVKVRVFC